MKRLNVLVSIALAMLPLSTMGQSAMAQGLPKFFNPQKNGVTIDLGTNKIINSSIWIVNGKSYFSDGVLPKNLLNVGATAVQANWAKAHAEKIFANEPAIFVNEAEFVKKFYHKFHPIMKGPNLAPPLPKGVTMAQWKAAVVQAKEVTSPLLSVSEAMALSKEYSPLSTKTQWFNDPSDPFFNKRFPVKDLKDGFVISHKPLVIVSRAHGEIDVMQYVGGGDQGTLWMGEQVDKKGYTIDIGYALSGIPNAVTPYFHPYKNLGITVNAVTAQNLIWASGGGLNVVPLPHWNPSWLLQPIGSPS